MHFAHFLGMRPKLAEDLEEHVPYVKDMKFLGNVEYIEGVEGGIEISALIEDIPETPKEMKLVKKRAMNQGKRIWIY